MITSERRERLIINLKIKDSPAKDCFHGFETLNWIDQPDYS